MTPHEAAQSLWWFVAIVLLGIAIVLFIDCRKEKKDKSKDYIFDPSQPVKKFQPPRSLDIAKTLIKEKHND